MSTAVPDETIKTLMLKAHPTVGEFFEMCPDSGTKTRCQLEVIDLDETQSGLGIFETGVDDKLVKVNMVETLKCGKFVRVAVISECPFDLAWDSASDDTIERPPGTDTASVAIIGTAGPYEWAVSGVGFSLDETTTTGLSNTLNADATACGSATITVTDSCETSVTGYVRCTTSGQWVLVERYYLYSPRVPSGNEACGMSGPPDTKFACNPAGAPQFGGEKIEGKYRVQEWAITDSYTTACGSCVIDPNTSGYTWCIFSTCSDIHANLSDCDANKSVWCCTNAGSGCGVDGDHQMYSQPSIGRWKHEWTCL